MSGTAPSPSCPNCGGWEALRAVPTEDRCLCLSCGWSRRGTVEHVPHDARYVFCPHGLTSECSECNRQAREVRTK